MSCFQRGSMKTLIPRNLRCNSFQFLSIVCICYLFMTVTASKQGHRWHLQRIVQRGRLNDSQIASGTPRFDLNHFDVKPVNVYVVDSGIRIDHEEFETGRALYGVNIQNLGSLPSDCDGHGTHVASLAVGLFSGVAKKARVIAVRVLDCNGKGTCSDMMGALEWIIIDIRERQKNGERSVVVMSIGSRNSECSSTLQATQLLWDAGVVVAAAAGNNVSDACELYPARNPRTIAVGATDFKDHVYRKNNYGDCIDVFAPGVDLLGAWGESSKDEWKVLSGSSMAAPIVAGTAAVIMGADPLLSAADVREVVLSSSTRNRILSASGNSIMTNSVNRLIFVPWSRLFDEVKMNSKRQRSTRESSIEDETDSESQFQDPDWNSSTSIMAVSLTLQPRTYPAMSFAVQKIVSTFASVASLKSTSILPRRASGVQLAPDGMEPSEVRLVFYIPMLPNYVPEYRRRLEEADRSGKLSSQSGQSFSFAQGSLGTAVLLNVTVPAAAITEEPINDGDKSEKRNKSSGIKPWQVALISIGSLFVLVLLVGFVILLIVPKVAEVRERRETIKMARERTVVQGLDGVGGIENGSTARFPGAGQ